MTYHILTQSLSYFNYLSIRINQFKGKITIVTVPRLELNSHHINQYLYLLDYTLSKRLWFKSP